MTAGTGALSTRTGGIASFVIPDQTHATVTEVEHGVIRVELPRKADITEEMALEIGARIRELLAGRRAPVLLQLTGVASISRGARAIYRDSKSATAYALLGETSVDRVIATFFLGSEPPNCPTAFFTAEEEALDWLKEQAHE